MWTNSLRLFGLAAVDDAVLRRVLAVAARDYDGIALELRTDPPADFALYSEVDIEGPDPNDLGLLGNDNSPGKDVDNQRLFDRIGGSAAGSQTDGFPGFGGVFVESFLVYSAHPPARVQPIGVTSRFDDIFDSVRPDSGMPVSALEARAGIAELTDGAACLDRGRDRATRVACAVHVLGNLIGSTLSHELGHSLGLADPYGTLAHDPGDADNRLMDAGGARPFEERAELEGRGPAVFCDDEYAYLRRVLPGAIATRAVSRPSCR